MKRQSQTSFLTSGIESMATNVSLTRVITTDIGQFCHYYRRCQRVLWINTVPLTFEDILCEMDFKMSAICRSSMWNIKKIIFPVAIVVIRMGTAAFLKTSVATLLSDLDDIVVVSCEQ